MATVVAVVAATDKHGIAGMLQSVGSFIQHPSAGTAIHSFATVTGLDEQKINRGLKEALTVGVRKTIQLIGVVDGFLLNTLIKILVPPPLHKLASRLRKCVHCFLFRCAPRVFGGAAVAFL